MIRTGVLATLLAAGMALAPSAPAQTFAEVELFDRPRQDCDLVQSAQVDCTYRWRLLLHLESAPLEGVPWLRLLARIEILSRRASDEPGHFEPLTSDLGGGLVLARGAWSLRLLLSSRHCMDVLCDGDAYNSLTVRWQP
jgi:hypothetical protein